MAGEDNAYLARVRTLRCRAAELAPQTCMGGHEANHAGERGVGQRAHDHTAFCLCLLHHRHWSDGTGVFKHWTKEQRAAFAKEAIEGTRARLNLVDPQELPRPRRAKRTKKKPREVGRIPARVVQRMTPPKRYCAGSCGRLMSPGRLWKDLCIRCTRKQRIAEAKGFDADADRRDEGLEVFTIGRGAR